MNINTKIYYLAYLIHTKFSQINVNNKIYLCNRFRYIQFGRLIDRFLKTKNFVPLKINKALVF